MKHHRDLEAPEREQRDTFEDLDLLAIGMSSASATDVVDVERCELELDRMANEEKTGLMNLEGRPY